jgi:hypothetical protein
MHPYRRFAHYEVRGVVKAAPGVFAEPMRGNMTTKPKHSGEARPAPDTTKSAPSRDERLDDELEDSFPASDPPTVTRDLASDGANDSSAPKRTKPR